MKKIAVVRIRGTVNIEQGLKDTMDFLGLRKKHNCAIIDESESTKGMLQKAKDFITWGEASEETIKSLGIGEKKKVTHLAPPRGGFERKGIKQPFKKGGALGNRGEKINDLIKKMLK